MSPKDRIDSATRELFSEIRFAGEPSGLYDPLRYMIEIGGKRIRPRLCLTTYSLYKDSFGPEILEPAAALEVFHSFTLIHDDIMDRSPLRRKAPTVWKRWSPDTAILSGDAMCIDSYSRIAHAPSEVLPQALALFSKTAAEVCEGQQYDMEFEDRETIPMESYIKMVGLKTGVLIACSAALGALIGGASEEDCRNLYEYGYNLGLAFQVADDYLDAYGDEKVFGKPIGGDILNKKKSWLTVRAFEKADGELRSELLKAMDLPASTSEEKEAKIHKVKGIYSLLDIGDDAKRAILDLNAKAMECAGKVARPGCSALLGDFARQLIGRSY